ncbi:MAG: hypothetical protein QM662_02455 [Gordonia sp. (in: high G+C Gram-positive bacteria)]
MAIPDGYAVAPTQADNLAKLMIPIPGRETPVTVEVPRLNWTTPAEVRKYREWLKPYSDAEEKMMRWNAANAAKPEDQQEPKPDGVEKLLEEFEPREITLRWLKPYVSAADYRVLMEKIPEGTVRWIKAQIERPDDDITVGESSASANS